MAQISLTIPDAALPRVVDAMASRFNYDRNKQTDETKGQFAKRMLGVILKDIVVDEEAKKAANTAFDAARSSASTDVTIS